MVSFDRIAYYKAARIWLTVLWIACAFAIVLGNAYVEAIVLGVNALVWFIYSREIGRWIRSAALKDKDPDTP